MPATPRPGMRGKYVEIPERLLERFEQFCERRGTKFAAEMRRAMERHMRYPPRDEIEPLPDATGGG